MTADERKELEMLRWCAENWVNPRCPFVEGWAGSEGPHMMELEAYLGGYVKVPEEHMWAFGWQRERWNEEQEYKERCRRERLSSLERVFDMREGGLEQ